jgi:hypothetical protein
MHIFILIVGPGEKVTFLLEALLVEDADFTSLFCRSSTAGDNIRWHINLRILKRYITTAVTLATSNVQQNVYYQLPENEPAATKGGPIPMQNCQSVNVMWNEAAC